MKYLNPLALLCNALPSKTFLNINDCLGIIYPVSS